MIYAVIAAGEGSRLVQEGIDVPKPLVPLHGEPMIDRLIRLFNANGATGIFTIVNEVSPSLEQHLRTMDGGTSLTVIVRSTPSSLHSFHALLSQMENVDECCLTTTDTVFKEGDFKSYIQGFHAHPEADAYMGVTPFVDDESPLYVSTGPDGQIVAFSDERPQIGPLLVSGGIYCLRRRGLQVVHKAVAGGTVRMRNFQRQLLAEGLTVQAHVFPKIVDVDHARDIQTAETFLAD